MTLALTTLARVKAYLKIDTTNTQQDALLTQLITGVSTRAEQYMGRMTEIDDYVEYLDVEFPGQKRFHLSTFPVTAVSEVNYDPDGDYESGDALSTSDFRVNLTRGQVHVRTWLARAFQGLRISYTGGMASDTAEFITAFEEITDAIDKQVAYEFQRRRDIGLSSVSGAGGTITQYPLKEFIPLTKAVLDKHRRFGAA